MTKIVAATLLSTTLLCLSFPAQSAWEQVANTARSAKHQGYWMWVHYAAPACEPSIFFGARMSEDYEVSWTYRDSGQRVPSREAVADLRSSHYTEVNVSGEPLRIDLTGSARAIRAAENHCHKLVHAKPAETPSGWVATTGRIEAGWADATIRRIREANAAGLVLESGGGLIYEAEQLGRWLRNNELDTAVVTHCSSACVRAFVGGINRYIAPDAALGLHRSRTKGSGSHASGQKGVAAHADYLRSMGIEDADAVAVRAAATTSMWIDLVNASEALTLGLATDVDVPQDAAQRIFDSSEAHESSDELLGSFWWVAMLFAAFTVIAALIGRASSSGRVAAESESKLPHSRESNALEATKPAGSFAAVEQTTRRDFYQRSTPAEQINALPKGKVEYVVDGDTVIIGKGWNRVKVRLDAIDCPENGQPWGDTARYGLIKLIGGRRVHLEEHGKDHYGRTLATIYVRKEHGPEWINVNERMVTLGHAWVMRKYYVHLSKERQDRLNRLEKWARVKRVGLWRTANPTPPWKWRGELRPQPARGA